jgi:hypothetical protein
MPTDWTLDLKAACYETLDIKKIDCDYSKNSDMIKKLFGEIEILQNRLTDFAVEFQLSFQICRQYTSERSEIVLESDDLRADKRTLRHGSNCLEYYLLSFEPFYYLSHLSHLRYTTC